MKNKIFFFSIIFFLLNFNYVFSANFKNYLEVSECVDQYNSFTSYKNKLFKCFKKQKIDLDREIIKLIENKSGIIDNIIELKLPNQETVVEKKSFLEKFKIFEKNLNKTLNPDLEKIAQEENIFNKPSVFSDKYNEAQNFEIDNKDFGKLNSHIKNNPKDIYALTEDINFLTFDKGYLSEFKRKELLLNIYNSFDPLLLKSLTTKSEFNGIAGGPQLAVLAAIGGIAAGGGGGGGGASSGSATISYSKSSSSISECGTSITFTANLTKAHTSNVSITYSTGGTATDGVDYNLSSTNSTIIAGGTSASITLSPVNDTTNETSETVIITANTTDVSSTGNTSTTITIHDYVLACNSTAFTEGTAAEQNTIKSNSNWTSYTRGSTIHPYEQMNIHKVQSFSSGGTKLTGSTETIHIADFHCNDSHEIFNNKTVTNLDDGGPGESTFGTADASNHHCQSVAAFASGDSNSDRIGVAPDADIILSSIPDTNTHTRSAQAHAADLDIVKAAGAIVSNHSWGMGTFVAGVDNASEIETYMNNNSLSVSQTFGKLQHNDTGSTSVTQWETWITALKNYQDTGVIVFASGNDTSESDAGGMAALPYFYDGTKHTTDLTKAWINAIVMDYTGDSDLTDITSSEVTLRGNPCGKTAAYCLSVDAWDMTSATYVDGGGTSQYLTFGGGISYGSSWSAPMISGGIALMAQAFPNHTPEQLVDRVLASANNKFFTPDGNTTFTTHGASIQHGYDDVFGHGIPDFYAALSPITTSSNPFSFGGGGGSGGGGSGGGGGSIPFSSLKKYPVSQTLFVPSNSMGNAISNGLNNKYTYAYDALNGGFKLYLSDFIHEENLENQKIKISLKNEIDKLSNFDDNTNIYENIFKGEFFNIKNKYDYGSSITLDAPNLAIQNITPKNNFYINPFLSENNGLGFNQKLYISGNDLFLSYNNSKLNPLTNINKEIILPIETFAASLNINNNLFEKFSVTAGILKEDKSFLLSKSSGAFEIENQNITNFYGINLSKNFNKNSILSFNNTIGFSSFNNNNNNFVLGSSDVLSTSFEIDYELSNIFGKDKFNFTLSQPNKVEKGEMNFRLIGLSDKNGIIPFKDHKINLSPSGRQKDLTLSYKKSINKNIKLGLKTIITDDIGHIKDRDLNTEFLITGSLSF